MNITRAVRTCSAAPSQWDAWTRDGRKLYLRFRHGRGSVHAYPLVRFEFDDALNYFERDDWGSSCDLLGFCDEADLKVGWWLRCRTLFRQWRNERYWARRGNREGAA